MTVPDSLALPGDSSSRPGPRARVGVFGIGLHTYWPQFPGLKERIEGYQRRVEERVAALVAGRISGKQGEKFKAGRLGEYTIGANGEIVLGPLTTFDKDNIDDFDF